MFVAVRDIVDSGGADPAEVMSRSGRSGRSIRLLALVGLPSGAALVVYFVAGISLGLALAITTACVGLLAIAVTRRLDPAGRAAARRAVTVGLVVGVAAVVAYDVSRFALVALFSLDADPWEALPLFGELLTGRDADTNLARSVGFLFHVANGVGFAVAYTIVLGRRGPVFGVGWALLLEAATLTFYPGWLDIRAIQEFATVSMVGHLCYGLTLGIGAARLLDRWST